MHRKEIGTATWKCAPSQVKGFKRGDPFNPGNLVEGYICRHEGLFGGSLLVTSVNGRSLDSPYHIFGTPKLEYPYASYGTHTYALPHGCSRAYFSNKWNGMNVLVFKYSDAQHRTFISMKSKGAVFLCDSMYGQFQTDVCEFLGIRLGDPLADLPILEALKNPEIQSISFELCGKRQPHLVKYDFDLDMKPLFYTDVRGRIAPIQGHLHPSDVGPLPYDARVIAEMAEEFQKQDEALNETYRREHNLRIRYEYGHFISEGRALYCLDEDGFVPNRVIYKVKPPSVEEVHWQSFDKTMQGKVRDALKKMLERHISLKPENLARELDMGPKEWSKFQKQVMDYVSKLNAAKMLSKLHSDTRQLVILIGFPTRQKSSFAHNIASNPNWHLIHQEEEASQHLDNTTSSSSRTTVDRLRQLFLEHANNKVVVDEPNLTPEYRKPLIDAADDLGVTRIDAVYFPLSKKSRARKRANRSLNQSETELLKVKAPQKNEKWSSIHVVREDHTNADRILRELTN